MEIKKERREWGFSLILSLIGWREWIQHLFNLSVIRKKHWNDIELCFEVFETKNQSVHDEIIIDTQTSSMKDKSPKHFHFIIWYVFVNDWIFQTLLFTSTAISSNCWSNLITLSLFLMNDNRLIPFLYQIWNNWITKKSIVNKQSLIHVWYYFWNEYATL